MKNLITITEKRTGNLFIGTPDASGQTVVATFENPTQAVKFFTNNFKKVIKATYSQAQTYYSNVELTKKEFWKAYFEKEAKRIYDNKVFFLAIKVRARAATAKVEIRNEEIKAEVNRITIDAIWIEEKAVAMSLSGMEKNEAFTKALKGLLSRNNIEKLNYFYQVMKAL